MQVGPDSLVKGHIIHAGTDGIWGADEMPWRKLEGKLLQAGLLLDASSCTEAEPNVAVLIEEVAAWRQTLWARFFCALEIMAAGLAGFSARSFFLESSKSLLSWCDATCHYF